MRLQTAPPIGIPTLQQRWNTELLGPKNGINLEYQTPEPFIYWSPYLPLNVYRNGIRLVIGVGNDYTVSESGGVGTGYDTIILAAYPPTTYENLTIDYVAAL